MELNEAVRIGQNLGCNSPMLVQELREIEGVPDLRRGARAKVAAVEVVQVIFFIFCRFSL